MTYPLLTTDPVGGGLFRRIARQISMSFRRLGVLRQRFGFESVYLGAEDYDLMIYSSWALGVFHSPLIFRVRHLYPAHRIR